MMTMENRQGHFQLLWLSNTSTGLMWLLTNLCYRFETWIKLLFLLGFRWHFFYKKMKNIKRQVVIPWSKRLILNTFFLYIKKNVKTNEWLSFLRENVWYLKILFTCENYIWKHTFITFPRPLIHYESLQSYFYST